MITLLYIFFFLALGMTAGHVFRHQAVLRLLCEQCSSLTIVFLLFTLGCGLGHDEVLFNQLPLLGGISFGLALASVLGSVIALLPLNRFFQPAALHNARTTQPNTPGPLPNARPDVRPDECPDVFPCIPPDALAHPDKPFQHNVLSDTETADNKVPTTDIPNKPTDKAGKTSAFSIKNLVFSLGIVVFFLAGVTLARYNIPPQWVYHNGVITGLLCLLVFAVGVSLGAEIKAFLIIRRQPILLLAIPFLITAGSLAGAFLFSLLTPLSSLDAIIASAGLGYYSLASVLVEQYGFTALAAITLLSNIFRELLGILTPSFMVPVFGRLSPVGVAAVPAMDTCLPMIARYAGEQVAISAVISGVVLTALAPFFVAFLLLFK